MIEPLGAGGSSRTFVPKRQLRAPQQQKEAEMPLITRQFPVAA